MTTKALESQSEKFGKVVVAATIENLGDLYGVRRGHVEPANVRRVEVNNAIVDIEIFGLGMPPNLIEQLGLRQSAERTVTGADCSGTEKTFDAVRLTVQGRECIIEATKSVADCIVSMGWIVLSLLDFVVDTQHRQLVGAHGDQPLFDHF